MQKSIRMVIGAFMAVLVMCSTAIAGPFEDATVAYQRGEYAEALKGYRQAAEQGITHAQYMLGLQLLTPSAAL